jgi:hypothetical protein
VNKGTNIVYEWASKVKKVADQGKACATATFKNEAFSKISGLCEGILCTLDCVADQELCEQFEEVRDDYT